MKTKKLGHDLLEMFSKMNKKDFKSFRNYSFSVAAKATTANQILEYIDKYYPNLDTPKLEEEYAFSKIFKGETFSKTKIYGGVSDLRKQLNNFLILEHLKENDFEKNSLLLKIYEDLKIDNQVQRQLKLIERTLQQKKSQTSEFWINKLQVSHENYFNLHLEKIAKEKGKLETIIEDLDNFHALAKLKYACEIYSRTDVINEQHKEIKYLADILKQDWSKTSILHHLYHLAYQLIITRKEASYFQLKSQVIENIDALNQQDRYVLLTYLANHSAYCLRKGEQKFGKEVLDLFKYQIQHNLFIIKGHFDATVFSNIVDLAGGFGEHKWSKEFMEKWRVYLKDKDRDLVLNFCNGLYLFWKDEYNSALGIFCSDFKKNAGFNLKSRLLRLACKHGNKNINDIKVLEECAALKNYLYRESITNESTNNAALNFVKIIKQLVSFQPDKGKILRKLEGYEAIHYKSWLKKKINELA